MRKHKCFLLLALVVVLAAATVALAACSDKQSQTPHTHSYVEVAATEPTCVDDGNYLYYTCSCGKYFDASKQEITFDQTVIAATGIHTESEWIVETEPNCTDEGYHYKKCVVCNERLMGESMPTNNKHIYGAVADGKAVCTKCQTQKVVYRQEGDSLFFGQYPQSKVTVDDVAQALSAKAGALPTAAASNAWTSYGYYHFDKANDYAQVVERMWYIDVEYQNEKYRGVYFEDYRMYDVYNSDPSDWLFESTLHQKKNGYLTSNVYWFKWEPIEWVINDTATGKMLVANLVLDAQAWSMSDNNPTYAESDVRKWLNDQFYNTAFEDVDKTLVSITDVANDAASTEKTDNPFASESTKDNVFLLSMQEVSEYSDAGLSKRKKASDYAGSQGATVYNDSVKKYKGNAWWRTRSHDDHGNYVFIYGYDGTSTNDYYYHIDGIVPAIYVTL